MITRVVLLLIVVCAAAVLLRSPRSTSSIDMQSRSASQPLQLPLPPREEILERRENVARVLGPPLAEAPATFAPPLRIELLIPGRTTHLAAFTIREAFAASRATLEGSALDIETGELFAWGADHSGNDFVLIATSSQALADINNDASINPDDAFRFLELLDAADPRADLDSNGVIDAADLCSFFDDFLRAR